MATKIPKRNAVPVELTWNLDVLYPNLEAWEDDFARVKALLPQLDGYVGRLTKNGHVLRDALLLKETIDKIVEKLGVYAKCRLDEDLSNNLYQDMDNRSSMLFNEVSVESAFIPTELLAAKPRRIQALLKRYKVLRVYRQYLNDLELERDAYLSVEKEEFLAEVEDIADTGEEIFDLLNNADLKLQAVADSKGKKHELTVANSDTLTASSDRVLRQNAYQSLFQGYGALRNTFASCFAAHVKKNQFFAKTRGYKSCLEAALEPQDLTVSMYSNLLAMVSKNLPSLHRLLALSQKALKLPDLHLYDLNAPIVGETDYTVTYPEAQAMVLGAVAPLGADYTGVLGNGYASRWVDVVENENKRSGAYSFGAYGLPPYILLNWQNDINWLFTLAHESGHSMHAHYSNKHQPYIYCGYPSLVSEVASICNEFLLAEHMLKTSSDPKFKMQILSQVLNMFRSTLFRQAKFAEFEHNTHRLAERGETLTADNLSRLYHNLIRKYYGAACVVDKEFELEWAYVPHFYDSFYVYQYVVGIVSAAVLSQQILQEGEPAVKRYIQFLSSGCSEFGLVLLKKVGLDFSGPEPMNQAIQLFERYIDQFEKLLSENSE
ncbi:MAG: oligoendopeptidase F [Candidatus Obscuribacterales bacterium]|nr:oligoendopeptidase F [Candidatus Obscuribacterales bacterium]